MTATQIETRCCIAGGGPAGMMLGFLLARAGVEVVVLEKHDDFFRDFRGDTIHPSTLELVHQLGLLEDFLALPHQKARRLTASFFGETVPVIDFSLIDATCQYIAFMPQWDFLDFLNRHASELPGFRLEMGAKVEDLIERDGRFVGVRGTRHGQPIEVLADLVIGADGRSSTVRGRAGLPVTERGAPIDVLWLRLDKRQDSGEHALLHVAERKILVLIDRHDYWQCAVVIPKGDAEKVRQRGLEALCQQLVDVAPFVGNSVEQLDDWDDVSLLTVKVDFLSQWHRPGLLCIGDAAHAMSPIGGVGINLAIQDAVAAANILAGPLLENRLTDEHLEAVQRRRALPTMLTQRLQVLLQNRLLGAVLSGKTRRLPWPLKLLRSMPELRRVPSRFVGLGFRPESIHKGPDTSRNHGS